MFYNYWITRDNFARQITVNFASSRFQNLNAFLNMSRCSALRQAVEQLRAHPQESYRTSPGEYLSLRAEAGMVDAEIHLFEDCCPVRLPVEIFCRITEEYLEELDRMCQELGLQ